MGYLDGMLKDYSNDNIGFEVTKNEEGYELKKKHPFENSPYLDSAIYDDLPQVLKQACSHFEGRKKDMFLLSSLSMLSAIFPNCYYYYGKKKNYPNLYFMQISPSASGKSVADFGSKLLDSIEAKFDLENAAKKAEWKSREDNKEPEPIDRQLYVPIDSSHAGYKKIMESSESCIGYASELDSLVDAMNSKHGTGISQLFRDAFQHEKIKSFRVTNNDLVKMENPKLSLVLTGTQDQLGGIFKSAKNGLFSRFLFYVFQERRGYVSQIGKGNSDNTVDNAFKVYADKILQIYEDVNREGDLEIKIDHFKDDFDRVMEKRMDYYYNIFGSDADSVTSRMCVSVFRIAMVLHLLRTEGKNTMGFADLGGIDYLIAHVIVSKLVTHTFNVYSTLENVVKGEDIRQSDSGFMFEVLRDLPKEFTTQDAYALLESKNSNESYWKRHYKKWIENGLLTKIYHGKYKNNYNNEI